MMPRIADWSHGAHATLAAAEAACGPGEVVVVLSGAQPVNLDPYLAPREVVAGGGYVLRAGADGPDVLLIFRRGAWDLPKGKQDPGEAPEETALREVKEEVGIRELRLLGSLGTTVHGYPEPKKDRFAVKTTHWFAMATPETAFAPEEREGIEAVEWVPWDEAVGRLGFETLRRHAAAVARDAAAYVDGQA